MKPIQAEEGWFVSHLFFHLRRDRWDSASGRHKQETLDGLKRLVSEFRRTENCQLHMYSVWGLKADVAVLMIAPDLNRLNETEYRIQAVFPSGVLQGAYSYTSMSEVSEYMSQDQDYDRTLREKEGLAPDSEEYRKKMEVFRNRMQVYINERLYPKIPEHEVMCFYPMSKSRDERNNWYALDFDTRKMLMAGHSITGRKYAGKVKQLVTGSAGLDAWEWGVTLFSNDPYQFKKIVYEMRYDEASARYALFGDFLVGIRLEPDPLFEQLNLI